VIRTSPRSLPRHLRAHFSLPTNLGLLDRAQFHALGQAHVREGGGPVYVTGLRGHELDLPPREENACHEIDFNDPQTYFADDYPPYRYGESLIVPISGRWGVLVAEHYHAVVAGTTGFVQTLLEHVTLSPEEMALLLVRRWNELAEIGLPSPWLPSLLQTIYGSEEAARLTAD
jgi:hypothetical protein